MARFAGGSRSGCGTGSDAVSRPAPRETTAPPAGPVPARAPVSSPPAPSRGPAPAQPQVQPQPHAHCPAAAPAQPPREPQSMPRPATLVLPGRRPETPAQLRAWAEAHQVVPFLSFPAQPTAGTTRDGGQEPDQEPLTIEQVLLRKPAPGRAPLAAKPDPRLELAWDRLQRFADNVAHLEQRAGARWRRRVPPATGRGARAVGVAPTSSRAGGGTASGASAGRVRSGSAAFFRPPSPPPLRRR